MHVIITGVSRGLGRALVELFLEKGHEVMGIGRTTDIVHPNYRFTPCDLSNPNEIGNINFPQSSEILLVNNAGIIGQVRRLSDQDAPDCEEVMNVNALAPMLLAQLLLKQMPASSTVTIVNISSGASSRAIPGWASYCASKAALDRFSETLYLEEVEKGRNIRVYSLSPGVIDTPMQEKIRRANPADFSSHATFESLKIQDDLQDPKDVATKIFHVLQQPYYGKVICSLREIIEE
jgi:benzil reductase ((S)-benzoin forming)